MEYTTQTLPPMNPRAAIRGVYLIKNTISNNCYIGSSIDVMRRLRAHIAKLRRGCHHSYKFQGAWTKYGEMHFRFSILEIVPADISIAVREEFWFARLAPTYNVSTTSAATPMLGRRHRTESIALMRLKKRGSKSPNKGKQMSPESRARLSAARKGQPNPSAKRPRTEAEKANLRQKARERFAGGPSTNPRARAIEIDGITYATGAEAAIALGISHAGVIRYIKRGRGRYLDGFPSGITPKAILLNSSPSPDYHSK